MLGFASFSVVGGLRGFGERGPRPGDVGGTRWVIIHVRHHGPLRLAHIRWVSVACAGQVNTFPVGVPDQKALVDCVARSRFVGSYEGVLLGKVGSLGVVAVDRWFRSRSLDAPRWVLRREGVIPGPSPPLRMAGAGFVSRVRGGASSLQCRWPAAVGRACVCRVGWAGAVPMVLRRVFMRVCSRFRPAVAQRPGGFPTRCPNALQRALRILCTRAACAACASVSVRMAGCSCSPSASARILWISKTGHRLGTVGVSAVRSRWATASSCC